MKLIKRLLIVLVIVVPLLAIGAYVAVRVFLPPEKVMAMISQEGTKALGREVKVESASVGIFPTIKMDITGVTLANAEGFSKDPMFNLKQVLIKVDFMSLVRMNPVIKEIRIVEPDILYEVNKKGQTNLDGIGGEPKEKKAEEAIREEPAGELKIPGALAMEKFVIENARVRYRDMKTGQVVELGSINQEVSLSVDPNLEAVKTTGKLVVSSISVSDAKSGLRKGNVKVSFGHDLVVNLVDQTVKINNVSLGLQDILLELRGAVKDFMKPIPSVDIKLTSNEIKMASLLKEVPPGLSPDIPKLRAGGYAKLDVSVMGPIDTAGLPDLHVKLSLNKMSFGHSDLPAGINDLNGLIQVTPNALEISNFGFLLDKHPVSVEVLVTGLLNKVPVLKNFKIDSKVDLAKLAELADKFVGLPEGFSMAGMVESKIQAEGELDPANPTGLKAQGKVELTDVMLVSKELPDKLRMSGMLKVDNDRIDEDLRVEIGKSDLKVKAGITDYLAMVLPELAGDKKTKVDVDIVSNSLDLDQLLPMPSGEKEEIAEEETEPLTEFPVLPDLKADIKLTLKKTKLLDLEMTDYVQTISLNNQKVVMALGGKLYSGSFSNDMSVNLKNTKDAKVTVKLKLDKVEANDFITRLNDKLPGKSQIIKAFTQTDNTVYGKLSMDVDIETHGLPQSFADNMSGDIYVKLHKGRLVGVKMAQGINAAIEMVQEKVKVGKKVDISDLSFSKLDIALEAKDGNLIIKDCKLEETPAGALDLTGKIGFDNVIKLDLENHLSKAISSTILGGQKQAQSAAKGLTDKLGSVGKAAGSLAGGLAVVPEDKQGRAIAYYTMTGSLSDPKVSVDFKRMAAEASGGAADAAKDLLDQKKKELEAAARAEFEKQKGKVLEKKKELEDAAKAKVDAAKASVDEEKAKLEAKKDEALAKKKAAEEQAKAEAEKKKKEAEEKAKQEAEKKAKEKGAGALKKLF